MAKVAGTVYERTSDGGIGDKIAGAELVFRESGSVVATVTSDSDGTYSVEVDEGRYVARATHQNYEDFSTEPGYVVVDGEGVQTFNPFLKPSGQTQPRRPRITDFSPQSGHGGTKVKIQGTGFAQVRGDNDVVVGGEPATVVEASPTELSVIVANEAQTGPVEVTVNGRTGTGPGDFTVESYPAPGSKDDGPPIFFEGKGDSNGGLSGGASGSAGAGSALSATGTVDVLVSIVKPTDKTPSNPSSARSDVDSTWSNAATYFDQASFNDLGLNYTITSSWAEVSGDYSTYVDDDNFGSQGRLLAEAAQAAKDDGEDLDDYDAFVLMMYTDGGFLRGWNMGSSSNFKYSPEGINITLSDPINRIMLHKEADWGRCAHEIAHGLVNAPGALSKSDGTMVDDEDVYRSDLVDRDVATAQRFEMMAGHNSHPLFSAFFMTQLGWYDPGNSDHVRSLEWDRNPTSKSFEVVAHGLNQNTDPNRAHVVQLEVTDGLSYFIEVRQRPGSTSQVFDDSIPLNGAPNDGGVVVTKVLTDEVNLNQQMRFLTLLHETEVLSQGDTAVDPVRDIEIEVTNDGVQSRPLVCEVSVEWAQDIDSDPDGKFDLNVEPWDRGSWETPDIWVDRKPYGDFDKSKDSEGRPKGNGDKPKPGEKNRFTARIENGGSDDAQNVEVTYYAIEPPGVGDNGNWAPLKTVDIGTVAAGTSVDKFVDWVPVVDKHTCLKVEIGEQMGEVSFGNNSAQENVFEFTAPASSVPKAVEMETAVRNPRDEETIAFLTVRNVPDGYTVQFPHQWVWLDPKEERKFELTILPTKDYAWYRDVHVGRMTAGITLSGAIPRHYTKPNPPGTIPPSRMLPIGGVTADVTPKREVDLELGLERASPDSTLLHGVMTPSMEGQKVSVEVRDPDGMVRVVEAETDANGNFEVVMDLTGPAPDESDEEFDRRASRSFVEGSYRAQAYTIAADHAAETNSNLVHFELTGKSENDDSSRELNEDILDIFDDIQGNVMDFFSRFTGNDDTVNRRR